MSLRPPAYVPDSWVKWLYQPSIPIWDNQTIIQQPAYLRQTAYQLYLPETTNPPFTNHVYVLDNQLTNYRYLWQPVYQPYLLTTNFITEPIWDNQISQINQIIDHALSRQPTHQPWLFETYLRQPSHQPYLYDTTSSPTIPIWDNQLTNHTYLRQPAYQPCYLRQPAFKSPSNPTNSCHSYIRHAPLPTTFNLGCLVKTTADKPQHEAVSDTMMP